MIGFIVGIITAGIAFRLFYPVLDYNEDDKTIKR